MSQTTAQFILTYQTGTNPIHYGIVILINQPIMNTHPEVSVSEIGNGQMDAQNLLYTIQVDMTAVTHDPVILKVDLGSLQIHPENGEVDVTLVNGGNQVGHIRIKVKEAQDESRPFFFEK